MYAAFLVEPFHGTSHLPVRSPSYGEYDERVDDCEYPKGVDDCEYLRGVDDRENPKGIDDYGQPKEVDDCE